MPRTELDTIRQFLTHERDYAQSVIDEFKTAFAKSPSHTFDWSENVFRCAAVLEVFDQIIDQINVLVSAKTLVDFEIVDEIRTRTVAATLQRATIGSSSTSPISNFMNLMRLAAWANVANALKG